MSSFTFSFHRRCFAVLATCSRRLVGRRRRCIEPRACEPRAHEGGPYVGWFDSSHDLLNGLAVTEHGDAVDAGLAGVALGWEDCVSA